MQTSNENQENEQLEYEDIETYLTSINDAIKDQYNNIDLKDVPDFVALAKSFGIADNIYSLYEVMTDKDIPGAIAVEISKLGGAAAGAFLGAKLGLATGNPYAAIAGIRGTGTIKQLNSNELI